MWRKARVRSEALSTRNEECGAAKKNERGALRSPPSLSGWLWLESCPQAELQLAHAVRRVRRSIGFDRRDLPGAGTIDAGIALRGVEAKDRMVEDVVGVEPELRLDTLGNGEILQDGKIRGECMRAPERVAPGISERAASWKRHWAGGWTIQSACVQTCNVGVGENLRRLVQGRNGSKPKDTLGVCGLAYRDALTRYQVWPAVTDIIVQVGDLATMAERRRKGQATAPVGGVRDLPSSDEEIHRPAKPGQVLLALAKR